MFIDPSINLLTETHTHKIHTPLLSLLSHNKRQKIEEQEGKKV